MATNALSRRTALRGSIAPPPALPVPRSRGVHRTRRGPLPAVDAFFRRQDTRLARGLAGLSPGRGSTYAASAAKRSLDLAVSIPLAVMAILIIALLVLANKLLSPGYPALFRQDRVGRGGAPLRVVKIRSMASRRKSGAGHEVGPICTAFGRLIRQRYLDELPQVFQVLVGQLSLVGIRVLPRDVYDGLQTSWSDERFAAWQAVYAAAPLGLTGAHQVFRGRGKQDRRRYHRDMFYVRRASLGFDLYLLWRTLGTTDSAHTRASAEG